MKVCTLLLALALACFGGYLAVVSFPSAVPSAVHIADPPPGVPAEVAALSGVWEGLGPEALPTRLVVEDIHDHWATVVYTWGDHPQGKFYRGWLRVRAVVFPEGKIFWRHPGEFVFQLSEDWTTLVGKRNQGGRTATSLMRRVPSETVLSTLVSEEAPDTP